MAKPTFMGIWSKNLSLGDSKRLGCLIQPSASAFCVSLVEGIEISFSCISKVSWQEGP